MHSSGIHSVQLSAYSSNILRWISDFCLLNNLYMCLPIYKAWNLVWCCGYCVQSRKCHVRYNSHLETHDVRCLVSPSRAFCSSHLITPCCLLNLLTCEEFWACDARCESCFGNTKHLEIMYSNWWPTCTLLTLIYCICVSAGCSKNCSSLINSFF